MSIFDTALLGDIEHVEDEHDRRSDMLQFQRKPYGKTQIGGIRDTEKKIGNLFSWHAAQHEIARDFFIRAACAQGIAAGQIENLDLPSLRRRELTGFSFDRHTGIIGNLLTAAGQGVEQRGLAAIGIADQRQGNRSPAAAARSWRRVDKNGARFAAP